jgi:hypothetical protein
MGTFFQNVANTAVRGLRADVEEKVGRPTPPYVFVTIRQEGV